MIKERGILFSPDMIAAILADRKFVTRRIIKPQPILDEDSGYVFHGNHKELYKNDQQHEDWRIRFAHDFCRYGEVGDRLYVREAWAETSDAMGSPIVAYKGGGKPIFIGKDNALIAECNEPWDIDNYPSCGGGWKSSLFMPTQFSRIWLEVEDVQIQRIADITEEQAIAEGIEREWDGSNYWYKDYMNGGAMLKSDPIKSFRSLWQKINGDPSPVQVKENGKLITTSYVVYPFDEEAANEFVLCDNTWKGKPLKIVVNPWVFCISFKVLSKTGKQNITATEEEYNDYMQSKNK